MLFQLTGLKLSDIPWINPQKMPRRVAKLKGNENKRNMCIRGNTR